MTIIELGNSTERNIGAKVKLEKIPEILTEKAQRFTILRSKFAYRINCEIPTAGRRIQDILDDMKSEYSYLPLKDAVIEKWIPEKMNYELTDRCKNEGALSYPLFQIGRTDVIYPHQATSDKAQANSARDVMENLAVSFPMIGLYEHVFGDILIPRGEEETEENLARRVAKILETRTFIALTETKNADLGYKLGLPNIAEIGTIIVPKWKIPILTLNPTER
ncbi:hypothetical protein HZA33_01485 [Candidatus Pacearchaeota archaeon]|nr:hypothetical protein [Candidatus Pacearchaeota archaeon]